MSYKSPKTDTALAPLGSTTLAPTDPLRRYLHEINTAPMLTEEEELNLARRYRTHGDVEAARKLVASHLRLVAKIAWEYRRASHNIFDLIQEGNVGLMTAVTHYDPDKGARLSYYAQWWIRSYILKYIIDNFRLVKLGTTKAQKKLFYNLMRERQRLEALGFEPTPELLSKQLDVSAPQVAEMERRLMQPEYALDAPARSDGEGASLGEFIPLEDRPADEMLAEEEAQRLLHEQLEKFSATLADRDRAILTQRLLAEAPATLQQIADDYGITKERVRQIEARLIQRLKTFLRESGVQAETID